MIPCRSVGMRCKGDTFFPIKLPLRSLCQRHGICLQSIVSRGVPRPVCQIFSRLCHLSPRSFLHARTARESKGLPKIQISTEPLMMITIIITTSDCEERQGEEKTQLRKSSSVFFEIMCRKENKENKNLTIVEMLASHSGE